MKCLLATLEAGTNAGLNAGTTAGANTGSTAGAKVGANADANTGAEPEHRVKMTHTLKNRWPLEIIVRL